MYIRIHVCMSVSLSLYIYIYITIYIYIYICIQSMCLLCNYVCLLLCILCMFSLFALYVVLLCVHAYHVSCFIYCFFVYPREPVADRRVKCSSDNNDAGVCEQNTPLERQRVRNTPNLPTNIVDFRGFDSSIILIDRGGMPRPMGDFPESLS